MSDELVNKSIEINSSSLNTKSFIFGPVASRRFGISLGIDLSPNSKQCNYDCLYCELKGAKTVEKMSEYPEVFEIVNELKTVLNNQKKIDIITITANGEPTLYPYLEELINEINKIKDDTKTLILSNGSTIYKKDVFETLLKFDTVKLSLDCVSQSCFKKLDRVHKSVDCSKIVEAMAYFSKITKNFFVVEILFVKNINDTNEEIELLYNAIKKINPHRVDIGTVDRPPAYKIEAISYEKLESIAEVFNGLNVNIVYKNRPKQENNYNKDEIISLIKRRPLTLEDVENLFDKDSKNLLNRLLKSNDIVLYDSSGVKFYKIS